MKQNFTQAMVQIEKENAWVVDGIKKKEILSLGLANITAEDTKEVNSKNLRLA